MKHLLVNGCSYAHTWDNVGELATQLSADKVTNLGLRSGSNNRTIRTSTEYILKNTDVDFVIFMITFINRDEAPWATVHDDREGFWVNYSARGIHPVNEYLLAGISDVEKQRIDKFISDQFMIKQLRNGHAYIDKFLINLMQFTSWLEIKNINYCIFNTGENFIPDSIENKVINSEIVDWLDKNKKIIDIKTFMSNSWMHQQGAIIPNSERQVFKQNNIELNPNWIHYGKDGHTMLNDFLYNYINEYCL